MINRVVIFFLGIFVIFGLSSNESIFVGKKVNDEYDVKAAFLVNFCKYIEWQDQEKKDLPKFRIAIYRHSTIEKPLEKLIENRKIDGKDFEIVKFGSLEECPDAQIVFLPFITNSAEFKKISRSKECRNSLLVSERNGRLNMGAGINFLIISNKIKFEINTNNLKQNKLKASSQLLKLAEKIEN